jgi:hypothetical protein
MRGSVCRMSQATREFNQALCERGVRVSASETSVSTKQLVNGTQTLYLGEIREQVHGVGVRRVQN